MMRQSMRILAQSYEKYSDTLLFHIEIQITATFAVIFFIYFGINGQLLLSQSVEIW